MNRNWLKVLWVLGFLGLLGYFTKNTGFYGFFGFFGFLSFNNIKDDERLIENVNKAARNGFIASMAICIVAIVFVSIVGYKEILAYGIPVIFIVQFLVFFFSFQFYDNLGR